MHDSNADVQARGFQEEEECSMMSPLPMRQLNTAAVNEKSGTKRGTPTPVVTGEH